jgi:hypothetical protein
MILGTEITSGVVTTTRARDGWHHRGAPRHTTRVSIHVNGEGALFFREERPWGHQLEPSRGCVSIHVISEQNATAFFR